MRPFEERKLTMGRVRCFVVCLTLTVSGLAPAATLAARHATNRAAYCASAGLRCRRPAMPWLSHALPDARRSTHLLSPRIRRHDSQPALPGTAVTTLAGGGTSPGPASASATLLGQTPQRVFFDPTQDSLYESDANDNVVRKINLSTGLETVVAGNGTFGYAGDRGPAAAAELSSPQGIYVDAAGNVYIADAGNSVVRMVAARTSSPYLPGVTLVVGDIYTVAGGGTNSYSPPFNALPATSLKLNSPSDVSVDPSGNLVIADAYDDIVCVVAGSATETFLGKNTTLTKGDLYTIAGNAKYTGLQSGVPATTTEMETVQGLALTPSGNLIITDSSGAWLLAGSKSDPLIPNTSLTVGDIYQFSAYGITSLNNPQGIAVDGKGNLYVADTNNQLIRLIAAGTSSPLLPSQTLTAGSLYTIAGTGSQLYNGDGEAATAANLYDPTGVAVDGSGNVYVSDSLNHRVRRVSASTANISTIAGDGEFYADMVPASQSQFGCSISPIFDSQGDIIVADCTTVRLIAAGASSPFLPKQTLVSGDIYTIAGEGGGYQEAGDNGPALESTIPNPTALARDTVGNLLVSDRATETVRLIAYTTSSPLLPGQTLTPGDIYLLAGTPGSGGLVGDGGTATSSQLNQPAGVVVDRSGNLLIADDSNQRIRLVAGTTSDPLMPNQTLVPGDIYTAAGGGTNQSGSGIPATSIELAYDLNMAVGKTGNLYLTGSYNTCLVEVVAAAASDPLLPGTTLQPGDIYPVSGAVANPSAKCNNNGDGGAALTAGLNNPQQIADDPANGNLYVNTAGGIRVISAVSANPLLAGQQLTPGNIYGISDNQAPFSGTLSSPSSMLPTAQGNLMVAGQRQIDLAAWVPSPPVSLEATSSSGTISLTWSAPLAKGSGPVTGYQILRRSRFGQLNPLATATGTSYTDRTAIPGGTYDYAVEAMTAYGNTQPSSFFTVTDVPTTPPLIHTLAGNDYIGPSSYPAASYGQDPYGVAVFGSTAYIFDSQTHVIRALDLNTHRETPIAGNGQSGHTGDGGPALQGSLGGTSDLLFDRSGNLVFPEGTGHVRLVAFSTSDRLMPGKTLVKGDLYTVAGSGLQASAGDGGPAIHASFLYPDAIAIDGAGNLLVGDREAHRVRLIAATTWSPLLPHRSLRPGYIYTAVGTGTIANTVTGVSGDNGPATQAQITDPEALAVDRSGSLIIGDHQGNESLRLVAGGSGDPLLPGKRLTRGDIYYFAGAGGSGGHYYDGYPAIDTYIYDFGGLLTTPSGDLLILDYSDNEVRLVAANTSDSLIPGKNLKVGYVYPVINASQSGGFSGDGSAAVTAKLSINGQGEMALDGAGNLYVTDTNNDRLREESVATGKINTVAGNGSLYCDGVTGTQTSLNTPNAVSTDAAGDVFISDTNNYAVRVIPKSTKLPFLPGKTLVPGDIYTVAGSGFVPRIESSPSGGRATSATIEPEDAIVDPSGNLLIADWFWPAIWLVAGSKGSDPLLPGQTLKAGDIYNLAGGDGGFGLPVFGKPALTTNLYPPYGLTTDPAGNLYATLYNGCNRCNPKVSYVAMVDASGTTSSRFLPGQTLTPGDIYQVAGNSSNGYSGDGGTATAAQLDGPDGLAIDGSGNLAAADYYNNAVRVIAGATRDSLLPGQTLIRGDIYTLAGNGNRFDYGIPATSESLGSISGVAKDPKGNLLVADYSDGLIWLDAATTSDPLLPGVTLQPGSMYIVAGNAPAQVYGSWGSGDGGPAVLAGLASPSGVTVDSGGNLYIADGGGSVVREVKVSSSGGTPRRRKAEVRHSGFNSQRSRFTASASLSWRGAHGPAQRPARTKGATCSTPLHMAPPSRCTRLSKYANPTYLWPLHFVADRLPVGAAATGTLPKVDSSWRLPR